MVPVVMALLLVALAASCGGDDEGSGSGTTLPDVAETITVTSPALTDGETVPERFTCDGEDVSPALEWAGLPDGTAEVVILVDDPGAEGGTFVHWVVWGLDGASGGLGENAVPGTASEGTNGFGDPGWAGPCPPEGSGPHRYRFTVLALSGDLDVESGATADEVAEAAGDLVLAQGRLTGSYER
jgi:Raf kinase inhibitor-like YbhB/YbcL family protein